VSHVVALVRLLPLALMGRLAIAFTEITLSVFVVSSSVVVGHQLKAWREWFYDPETTHPWAPTPKPSPSEVARTQTGAAPAAATASAVSMVVLATPGVAVPVAGALAVGGYGAACRPAAGNEQLVFINKVAAGADCVRMVNAPDGVHLIVETYLASTTDFGVIAPVDEMPNVRVYAPTTWPSPVLVIRGNPTPSASAALVLTWQSRSPLKLLGVSGQKVDLSTDNSGWPRLMVTSPDGRSRQMYVWTGNAFSAQ